MTTGVARMPVVMGKWGNGNDDMLFHRHRQLPVRGPQDRRHAALHPQLMRQERIEIEDDAVGIVDPIYAVEMPMMVKAFLEKARIRTDYFFFIYTYGMGYAEAFTQVEVTARKVGLTFSYIDAIQMVDNYIPFFDMPGNLMDCIVWVEALQNHDPPVRVYIEQVNLDTMAHTNSIMLRNGERRLPHRAAL